MGCKENDGNFIKLLELRSNEIPELKSILFKYDDPSTRQLYILSRDIQNEILHIYSNTDTRYLLHLYNDYKAIYGIMSKSPL